MILTHLVTLGLFKKNEVSDIFIVPKILHWITHYCPNSSLRRLYYGWLWQLLLGYFMDPSRQFLADRETAAPFPYIIKIQYHTATNHGISDIHNTVLIASVDSRAYWISKILRKKDSLDPSAVQKQYWDETTSSEELFICFSHLNYFEISLKLFQLQINPLVVRGRL